MISPDSFHREHILELKKKIKGSDPGIIEKAIYALSLVEQLVNTPLDFVFKGGTCLILDQAIFLGSNCTKHRF